MLDLLIRGLATWRVSHMLVWEDGPNDMLWHLRQRTGIHHDIQTGEPDWNPVNPLCCVWCTSVWVGAVMAFVPRIVAAVFALSAIGCILESLIGDNRGNS